VHIARGIEIGHIFQLGRKYAQALDLTVLDASGERVVVTMGSYGIGVTRAVAAIAEQHHDDLGLTWPISVAPYQVHIVIAGKDDAQSEAANNIAEELSAAGLDVLVDDRTTASTGVKFNDSELLGMPFILVVGRGLAEGQVELRIRKTGEAINLPVNDAAKQIIKRVADEQK
jgi:prolyl-tRNA synthetase